jgi:ribose-phosphate pyrophosphokinase
MRRIITLDSRLPFAGQTDWRWQKFANGEWYVRLPEPVAGDDCTLLFDFTAGFADWLGLGMLAHSLARGGASVRLAAPYLPYARQDKPEPGLSFGLQWFTDWWRANGIKEVIALQVHDIRLSLKADDAIALPITSLSCARPLAAAVQAAGEEFAYVVAPDGGAEKLAREVSILLPNHPAVIVMEKTRGRQGVSHQPVTGIAGGRVLVVDDIFDTGSTLLSCLEQLRCSSQDGISAAVVHGVFSRPDWPKFWAAGLERLWFSDSRPLPPAPIDPRWQVFPVLPVLEEYLSL